jgi:hypothetical protein
MLPNVPVGWRISKERGSAFPFVSRLTVNILSAAVTHKRKFANRCLPLDETLIATVPDERAAVNSRLAPDDLPDQIRSIESPTAGVRTGGTKMVPRELY